MKIWMMLNACLVTLFMVALSGCAVQTPAPAKQVTLATQSIAQAESSEIGRSHV